MKILAIRGANLASLAGDFAVDFTQPPLADAGLFAITGPTGAGKSTLLDALCLALYNSLPRLAGASRAAVGAYGQEAQQLAANDVKSVLRHGAGRGYAEVDFRGGDGKPYRARWEVARARNRPDGRLQDQKMTLLDLTSNTAVGTTRTEVQAEIVRAAGLTFDQFRRSVLLAQGDFDAFLKADAKDRAALLELMTGTEIYGRISVAAFERAKAERQELDNLNRDFAALRLLRDEEREAITAARTAADRAAATAAEALKGLEADHRWWTRADDLARSTRQAENALTQAVEREAAEQPARDGLSACERVAPLRPLVADVNRLTAEQQTLTAALESAGADVTRAQTAKNAAEAADITAKAEELAAERAVDDAQPLLEQAIALDTRISGAVDERNAAIQTSQNAGEAVKERKAALQKIETDLTACQKSATEAATWLANHADHAPLTDELPRWLEKLGEWDTARTHAAALSAARDRQEQAAATARTQALNLEADLAKLDDRLNADRQNRENLDQQLSHLDENALTERFTALGALENLLTRRKGAEDRANAAQQTVKRLRIQGEKAESDIAASGETLATQSQALRDHTARLDEAEQAYALAEAATGEAAVALRARLVNGQPCPVCGSSDHPIHRETTALTALLAHHRDRVQDLKAALKQAQQRLATAEATQKSAETVIAQVRTDLPVAEGDLAAAEADVTALTNQCTAAALQTGVEIADTQSGLDAVATARAAAKTSLDHVTSLRRQRDKLTSAIDDATNRRTAKAKALAEAERQLATATAESENAARALIAMSQQREAAEISLAVPLAVVPGWREHPLDKLVQTCRTIAEAVTQRRQALESGNRQAVTLTAQAETAKITVVQAEEAAARATHALGDAEKRLEQRLGQRQSLFNGQSVLNVRAGLEQARTAAKQATDRAAQALQQAGNALTAAQTRRQTTEQSLNAVTASLFQAQAALDRALVATGLPPDVARQALARDGAWIDITRERLAALADTRRGAESVLDERRRAEADHRATPHPALAGEALAAATAEQQRLADEQRRLSAEHAARLRDDDARRHEGTALQAHIAGQQQTADLWSGIAELIGSADGSKFRRFAQSLTLDQLLDLANHHLADLTPRYRLQRAPGGELDLQVIDRDMGGEVRSVAALSGGERFLTSLALALGLAGMTGSHALVQSLFIDEGFGSLDAASLEVAISALETLHAAGRKIGVISHVQPMVERIGVQVQVTRLGGGRSAVAVVSG